MGLTQKLGTIPLAILTDSSNNVGIGGSANASFKLQVTGATNLTDNLTMTIASGTKSIGFGGNTIAAAANALIYSDTNYLVLNSKAGSALYFNFDNANASSTINMFNGKFILTQAGAATFSSSVTANGDFTGKGGFNGYAGATQNLLIDWSASSQITTLTSTELFFGTNAQRRMTITSGGNVGIGTSSPAALLDVNGVAYFRNSGGIYSDLLTAYSGGDVGIIYGASGNLIIKGGSGATERMRITSGGNISINSTVNGGKLYVVGDAGAYSCNLQGSGTTGQSYGMIINAGTNSSDYSFYVRNAAQGSPYIYIRGDGYLYSASAWSGSDRRLKENIVDLDNGLNKVLELKARKFDFIDGFKNQYGFIAQELQEVIPDAVSVFDEEKKMLAVKMDFIVPHLVKAIQEQQAQIEELKAIVATK